MFLWYAVPVNAAYSAQSLEPQAVRGQLDLTQVDFQNTDFIELNGEWAFYWKQLLDPSMIDSEKSRLTSYVPVPQVWNNYRVGQLDLSPKGYATYHLKVKLNPDEIGRPKALYMPGIATAYKLWVDGKLLAASGVVGTSESEMQPKTLPKVVFYTPKSQQVDLVMQVSNFVQRKAGLWNKIKFGDVEPITLLREKNIGIDLLTVGALLIIGIYHLFYYFLRRADKAPLYFGIFCLLISLRTLLLGEMLFVRAFPDFSWGISVKMEYLTATIGVPVFVMYLQALYPKDCSLKFRNFSVWSGALFSLIVILTPPIIFTYTIKAQQVVIVISIVYGIWVILRAIYYRRTGSAINFVAILVLFLTIINDILFYNHIIFTRNLVEFGLLFFLLSHAFILSVKFSRSFQDAEMMSNKLHKLNNELDQIVMERTRSLEESKDELTKANEQLFQLSYFDGLTGLYNRRSFEAALNDLSELTQNRPLALIILDIDYFKEYNDAYGHQAGDHCLKQVAGCLQDTLASVSGKVARWGGEEFIMLLPDMDTANAEQFAEQLLDSIVSLHIPHVKSPYSYLTVSIGISSHAQITDKEQWIKEADDALYTAKRKGRNRICVQPALSF